MKPKPQPQQTLVKRDPVFGWLGLFIAAVVLVALPLPEWAVEQVYSRNIYPTLQTGLTSFSNMAPLSLLDLFILGAAIMVGLRIARVLALVGSGGVLVAAWDGIRRLLRAASVVTIVFLLFWGFNYRRTALDEALKVTTKAPPTVAELQQAIADANALASRLRLSAETGKVRSYESIAHDLAGPFNLALKKIGRPALVATGRPKYSFILTPFFTMAGVTGMIDPFALESIADPDLLPFERPFVLAHEWAHLAGQADEAEASAVGWLACLEGDPGFAYSASLYLIMEAGSALPSARWSDSQSHLDPGIRADIEAIRTRMRSERPAVQHATSRVYDQYLKANRVDDGVASYSRALSLILSPPFREAMATYTMRGR